MNKTTDLSLFENKHYQPAGWLYRASWYVISESIFRNGLFPFYGLKRALLRAFGGDIGKAVIIKPYVHIKYPKFLKIDENSWIGEHVYIDNLAHVIIGKNVCVSQGAMIICGNHNFKKKSFDLFIAPVRISDGAWLCAGSVVLAGSTMESHAVLLAGSTLSGVANAYGIYQGVPAVYTKGRVID